MSPLSFQEGKLMKALKMNIPGYWGGDNYSSFYFIHARWSEREGYLNQTDGNLYSCREYFVRALRYKYMGSTYNSSKISAGRGYIVVTHGKSNNERLRKQELFDKLSKSLAALNALERYHKWPLTKMIPVNHSGSSKIPSMLFISSAKWTRSPYLLSLYTLIIRGCQQTWCKPEKVLDKDWDDIRKYFKTSKSGATDARYMYQTVDIWDIMLGDYQQLFGVHTKEWNWSTSRLAPNLGGHRPEGILKLANGSSYHKGLVKEIQYLKTAATK